MVKPALPYLDVIAAVRARFDVPRRRLQRLGRVRDGQGRRRRRRPRRAQPRRSSRSRRSAAPAPTSSSPTGRRSSRPGSDLVRALAARPAAHPGRRQLARARDARGRGRASRSSSSAASGAYLETVDGRRLLDWVASWGPLIFGHADPETVEAVRAAAREGTSFGAPDRARGRARGGDRRRRPLGRDGHGSSRRAPRRRCRRCGSRAAVTGRSRVITFAGCYHGHADPFLAAGRLGPRDARHPRLARVSPPRSPPTPSSSPTTTSSAAAAAVERHGDELAAIFVEPVAGNMGCVPPEPGFLEALRALCDALRRAARLRRGDHRLPRRARRRAGALRRAAPT